MAILTIPKTKFEKEIGKLDESMKEKIAMFGTPIDDETSTEIHIELFPNRPDLLSYQNFKNAFLSFAKKPTGIRKVKINKPEKNYQVTIDRSLKNIRPHTACAIVKNLKFDDEKIKEIIDIQEKLHLTIGRKRKKAAIGIYPLEKIKLPITFKALSPEQIKFQPLEFPKEITGKQILSKHPAGREYGHLLQDFDKYPVFIDADNKILSMPPIINSHETGKISKDTKEIFIECSGSDFETLKKILNIITASLESIGGKVYQMHLTSPKTQTPNFTPEKMKLSSENINNLLGLELKEKEISNLLKKMGYNYSKNQVEIPAWRTDILDEVDIIEDIAIAYGYDNFTPEIPQISTVGTPDKKEILKSKIAEILTGLEMIETSSFHLINQDTLKKINITPKELTKLTESKTEYQYLRPNLTTYLMKIFSENIDVEYPQEIFQIGTIFKNENNQNQITEQTNLAIAQSPSNFTKTKQTLNYLEKMLDIKLPITQPENPPEHFINGRVAEIKFKNTSLGYFGEIHPRILKNFHIKMPVSLLEINLEPILKELK